MITEAIKGQHHKHSLLLNMMTSINSNEMVIAFCRGFIGVTASVTLHCLVANTKPTVMAEHITTEKISESLRITTPTLLCRTDNHHDMAPCWDDLSHRPLNRSAAQQS